MATITHNPLQTPGTEEKSNNNWIPEGYTTWISPDRQNFVVPDFMVPALHHSFEGYRIKHELNAINAAGSVSISSSCFSLKVLCTVLTGTTMMANAGSANVRLISVLIKVLCRCMNLTANDLKLLEREKLWPQLFL